MRELYIRTIRGIPCDICSFAVYAALVELELDKYFKNLTPHMFCRDDEILTSRPWRYLKQDIKRKVP